MLDKLTGFSLFNYDIQILLAAICVCIGVAVYTVLIWSLIKYRQSNSAKVSLFHKNTIVEVFWTIIPILILVAIALPSIQGIA